MSVKMGQFPNVVFDFNEGEYKACEDQSGILFHHIPKTAGSTFRAILESLFLVEEVCRAEIPEELSSLTQSELEVFKLYAGHFSYEINDKLLADEIWITFLRNPIDRVISYYHNLVIPERMPDSWVERFKNRKDWHEFLKKIRTMSLQEFILSGDEKAKKITANRQTQAFLPDDIRLKEADWAIYNQEYVDLAKKNLKERFIFIGMQEYFELSLDLFSMTFAINPIHAEPYTTNLNTNKKRGESYEIEPEVLALIAEKNTMDIELYDYAKKLFFERMHLINKAVVTNNQIELSNYSAINTETPSKELTFNIDDAYSAHGFYPISSRVTRLLKKYNLYKIASKMNLFYRWCRESPGIIELLFNFEKDKTYVVQIEVARCVDKQSINTVSLRLDEQDLEHHIKRKWWNGHYQLAARVESNALSLGKALHRLEILSDMKFEHEQVGARKLSIAISKIKVVRA